MATPFGTGTARAEGRPAELQLAQFIRAPSNANETSNEDRLPVAEMARR